MRIEIQTSDLAPFAEPSVGNVYAMRGGRAASLGHMMILFSIVPPDSCRAGMCLMIVIDKEGTPVGVTSYGKHYIENLSPIAFVEGLDDLSLVMRSL